MIPSPSFDRQRKQISTWMGDIIEEIAVNETLLEILRNHAEHMMQGINIVSSAELFPAIFAEANSSLLKYNQILIEINCKLEALLTKEIGQWNSICTVDNSAGVKQFIWNGNQEKVSEKCAKEIASITSQPAPKNPTQVAPQVIESANSFSSGNQGSSDFKIYNCTVNILNEKHESKSGRIANKETKISKSVNISPQIQKKVDIKGKKNVRKKKSSGQVQVKRRKGKTPSANNCVKPDLVVTNKVEDVGKHVKKKKEIIRGINITLNKKYKGFVTCLVSPMEFYVYFVAEDLIELNKCNKELELHLKKYSFPTCKPKGKTIAVRKKAVMEELGDYALLHHKSPPAFHRVKIKNWNMQSTNDLVTVHLLDIGETMNVSLYNLHQIPQNIMKYPAFATRCHLAGFPNEVSWNQRAIDFFRNWVNKKDGITIVTGKEKGSLISESLPVVICNESGTGYLNTLILDKLEETKTVEESLEKWDPMSEAYESNTNMYDFDVDDPAASIYGYVGKDYERVCKLYGNTGKCYKKGCKKEHVLLDSKGFTTDKEEVYIRALNPLIMPKVDVLNVRVTNIQSPTSFYCVLDISESGAKEENLKSLQSYMNQSRNISEMNKLTTPPAVGQVVIAKFPLGNSWHRAKVVSVLPEKDECTVFYVDCGATTTVNFSKIRAIEPRYLHFPFQAIFCEICGVGEKSETSRLAVEYLEEILREVSTIEIVSTLPGEQPHLIVNLYTSKGENVREKLLIKELVYDKENIHLDETKMMYLPG